MTAPCGMHYVHGQYKCQHVIRAVAAALIVAVKIMGARIPSRLMD